MKALILNSGLGHRMGVLTSEHPKCMTEISSKDTILSRQLKLIAGAGIKEVVRVLCACALTSLVQIAGMMLLQYQVPRSFYFITFAALCCMEEATPSPCS